MWEAAFSLSSGPQQAITAITLGKIDLLSLTPSAYVQP